MSMLQIIPKYPTDKVFPTSKIFWVIIFIIYPLSSWILVFNESKIFGSSLFKKNQKNMCKLTQKFKHLELFKVQVEFDHFLHNLNQMMTLGHMKMMYSIVSKRLKG